MHSSLSFPNFIGFLNFKTALIVGFMAYAVHVSCKLFLNGILCYLTPTDLSSTALKAWEESVCRDYPAAWQPASVFHGCFRLFARPTPSKKP